MNIIDFNNKHELKISIIQKTNSDDLHCITACIEQLYDPLYCDNSSLFIKGLNKFNTEEQKTLHKDILEYLRSEIGTGDNIQLFNLYDKNCYHFNGSDLIDSLRLHSSNN
jgi:hypothetical protein